MARSLSHLGGASHSRALSSAVLFLLGILMLIPVSARAEGEDSGSGTDEVTFTYISANPAGFDKEGANNLFDGNTGTKWCLHSLIVPTLSSRQASRE